MAETPLTRLFAERKIRFRGDVNKPLFCAMDVAAFLEDSANYRRLVKSFGTPKYYESLLIPAERRSARAIFLTERGLYKYLLQSKQPKAAEFQEFVFDLLATERKREVDEIKLQAKIKEDEQRLRIEALQMEVNSWKSAAYTSDWLLTRSAVDLEKGFRKPDAQWTDLAVYYIKRFNREMNKKVLDKDPLQLDYRLQRIAREAFDEPLMHYDGYAVFAKKAQELEAELKRGGKKDRVVLDSEIDWELFDQNLKIVQEARMRQEAEAAAQRGSAKK